MLKRKRKINIELNIAPLIDVVFLLLLFFVLTSYFIKNYGITIDLPKSNYSDNYTKKDNIIISIDEKGFLYLNNQKVNLIKIDNYLKDNHGKNVIIRAHKKSKVNHLVNVIDIAKKHHVEKLHILTKK